MSRAAFTGAALLIWTRQRRLIVSFVPFLLVLIIFNDLGGSGPPHIKSAIVLLRVAALVLPLGLFVSCESAVTVDLVRAESHFPRPFMRLPLTGPQMVLPFMLGAALVSTAFWLVAIGLSSAAAATGPPAAATWQYWKGQLLLPALALSLIAWVQALMWISFRRRMIRAWMLIVVLVVHLALYVLVASSRVPPGPILFLAVLQLPVAYAVAVRGVIRARRGEPPLSVPADRRTASHRNAIGAPFSSPIAAQSWFEWQAHHALRGGSLGLLLIPSSLSLTLLLILETVSSHGAPGFGALLPGEGLVFVVMFITGLASAASCAGFESTWFRETSFAMPPFFAALPLSTGDFAWAKLKCAVRRIVTLWGWFALFTSALFVVAGLLSTKRAPWVAQFASMQHRFGAYHAAAFLTLALLGLVAVTVVAGACIIWVGLLGRGGKYFVPVSGLIGCTLFIAFAALDLHPAWRAPLVHAVPAVLRVLATVKIGLLVWLSHLVWARGHYSVARLSSIVGAWVAVVAVVSALCLHYLGGRSSDITSLLCDLIVVLPVLGILAAPLALQLNRCR